MLQTTSCLHTRGEMAHLDITSSNVMLRKQGCAVWDQVRLIDFGLSQDCTTPGTHAACHAQNLLVLQVHQLHCCMQTSQTCLLWYAVVHKYQLCQMQLPDLQHTLTV